MSLNKSFFSRFFPSIDRFAFKASLIWLKQSETLQSLPTSLSNPLKLNYKYMAHFRPECIGSRIPGLIGRVTFIHDGYRPYNLEKNSYHVRCLSDFIATNVLDAPPLSFYHNRYSLEIGFAFVDPTEVLIFTPPIYFHKNIKLSVFIWLVRRRISLFLQSYNDPRVIRGISLFVVYEKKVQKNRLRKNYWRIHGVEVDQVLDTFGVTPPVFRGYRLGRDGKLIIPAKPPKKIYKVQVPVGRKPDKLLGLKLKIRRRRIRKKKQKKTIKNLIKIYHKNFLKKEELLEKIKSKRIKFRGEKTKLLRIKGLLLRKKKEAKKEAQKKKIRDQKIQENKLRDHLIREQKIRDQKIRAQEIKENELKEKQLREKRRKERRDKVIKKLSKKTTSALLVLFIIQLYFFPCSFLFLL